MKTRNLLISITAVAMLALSVTACGDDDAGEETTTTAVTTTAAGETTTTAAGETTTTAAGETTTTGAGGTEPIEITVIAKDVAFNVSEITVKAGQEVTLTLDNQDLSADQGHNIHVRTTTQDFFTGIHTAPNKESITFTINEAGTYTFFCDTHSVEMVGTFIVTP